MRLCSLSSGSSGNSIYVGTDNTHILIDSGVSRRCILNGLKGLDVSLDDIDAVMVTHEHSDHIKGLGVLLRTKPVPVYASAGTIEEIKKCSAVGDIPFDVFHEVRADADFMIKDICIRPMHISHDAREPLAFRFRSGEKNIAVVTDLGTYSDYTVDCLKGMDALLLEANHDVRMLQLGPYPYGLKRRILGDAGHLSNEASGRLLSRLLHDSLKTVILGHLSKENNLPELAYEAVRLEIMASDCGYRPEDFDLRVASRSEASEAVAV